MDESNGRAEGRRKRKINLEELTEDRISDLPDSLLHHILSFLPSTKEAIQTSIISKRWKNQWTHVSVLIFKFDYYMYGGLYDNHEEAFIRFIDNTLLNHDCIKIRKLHLAYDFTNDTNFSSKIQFATRKHVEELILESPNSDVNYLLPGFLFDNASLVKLEISYCYFRDDVNMNLGSLKDFRMESIDYGHLVANVISSSPLLEYLELKHSPKFVIASKSLKTLILSQIDTKDDTRIEISCPNLEELSVTSPDDRWSCNFVPHKMIEEVVSGCLLLRSLELKLCDIDQLVIASKSLKKLVLREIIEDIAIEISCPNLEDLNFCGYYYDTFKMMNTPSLVCANLNFEISQKRGCHEDMAKQIFEKLQNVKELTMGSWFIKTLSDVEIGGVSYTWSNIKILTLDGPSFEHLRRIVCAIRSSPMLERLVLKCYVDECRMTADFFDLNDFEEHYWNSDGTVVDCLLSHLKVVEIIGLSKHDVELKLVLNFIKFILKNARVLEKLVLVISEKPATDFTFEVSKKVSSFPRCSQHAIVELLCSK